MAVLAKAFNVPFYVAAESYKFARLFPLDQRDLPEGKIPRAPFAAPKGTPEGVATFRCGCPPLVLSSWAMLLRLGATPVPAPALAHAHPIPGLSARSHREPANFLLSCAVLSRGALLAAEEVLCGIAPPFYPFKCSFKCCL